MTSPTQQTSPTSASTAAVERALADEADERRDRLAHLLRTQDDPVTLVQRDTLERTLAEIVAAQARLADGSFGRCVRCARPIPAERLEVRPWAATCTGCAAS